MATSNNTKTFFKDVSSWREKISVSAYLTGLMSLVIFFIACVLSYQVFTILQENKYRDLTSIMFLELEKNASLLRVELDTYEKKLFVTTRNFTNMETADIALETRDGTTFDLLKGNIAAHVTLADFGVESLKAVSKSFISEMSGKSYFVRKIENAEEKKISLFLWEIDLSKVLRIQEKVSRESRIYILSREFKLLYTNTHDVRYGGLIKRNLIQHFIGSSIRKGQIKYSDNDRKIYYGFFSEIPNSNLILFSETPEDIVTYSIYQLLQSFMAGVFFVLGITIILLQFIYPSITSPLRELVKLSKMISQGFFNVKISSKGFGEINQLLQAFTLMGEGLKKRDTQIVELLKEKHERERLDNEFQIAKKIQENFLPQSFVQPAEGILVESFYQPADEVAGDWYQNYYDDSLEEFTAVIADVSGHGAGSSMFTAVIASSFEFFKIKRKDGYTIHNFMSDLNEVFLRLGKNEWHVTVLAAVVSKKERTVSLVSCGHQFPLILEKEGASHVVHSIRLPSSPLGLSSEIKIAEKTLPLKNQTTVLFFTDGLIEAKNFQDKVFGRKRLVKICEKTVSILPRMVVEDLMASFKDYCKDIKPQDDICIYALGLSV